MRPTIMILAALSCLTGACSDGASAEGADARPATMTPPAQTQQRGGGAPYEISGSQVWEVPDPVSGRDYEVFVSLPASYATEPSRRYPVLYVTDADYAFPIIRQIARRVNLEGPVIEEFILVGLSYARGESGVVSRSRDYTPTPNGPRRAHGLVQGGGSAYQAYLKSQGIPFIEARFRADPARRVLLGHSYGGLLGAQIIFSDPTLFDSYVLGSPSFWYDRRHIMRAEADYARSHQDLPAKVFMYIGAFETQGPSPRNNAETDMVGDMQAFERTLEGRGYPSLDVRSVVLADEDHLTVAPAGFTRALIAVLPATP